MAEGGLKWKYNAGIPIKLADVITDSNGVIYFGAANRFAANSKIIALNPDGTLKWEFLPPAWDFYYITGLALSNDESVLFAVDAGSDVYAIYTADGSEKWKYGISYGDTENPGLTGIVVDQNNNIYVGSWCCAEGFYSIDYAGNFRWDLGGDECHSGHAIGKSNTVAYYLDVDFGLREVQLSDGNINWVHLGYSWGCWGTSIEIKSDGTIYYQDCDYFYAMNPDGSEKWYFYLQSLAYPGAPYGISSITAAAINSEGDVLFGAWHDYEYRAICLNSDGSEKWSYVFPDWIGSGFAGHGLALDSNDIVFVACQDNNLYAINSDGTLRWTYAAGNDIRTGIAFSPSEDTVYFGSNDGYLYAIEKIPAPPTCGIVAVGDKVMLCPIGNRYGNMVALKSGKAALTDKALLASLNNQAALKLDFRNCKSKQGDKIICVPISGTKKNILGLR